MTEPAIEKPRVIYYEQVAYMRIVTDSMSGKKYYTLGAVDMMTDTLAVDEVGGNGGTRFFCQQHGRAYGARDKCVECQNAVVNGDNDATATACSTPEFQR